MLSQVEASVFDCLSNARIRVVHLSTLDIRVAVYCTFKMTTLYRKQQRDPVSHSHLQSLSESTTTMTFSNRIENTLTTFSHLFCTKRSRTDPLPPQDSFVQIDIVYRVTIQLVTNLPLASKQKLRFSLARPGQAKTELQFSSQREVLNNVLRHPVDSYQLQNPD